MLRAVENAGFEAVGGPLRRRWVFRTGSLESERSLSGRALARLMDEQEHTPVAVLRDGDRTWWMAAGQVVTERDGLSAGDVAALLAERAERSARRLERAHAIASRQGAPSPPSGRKPIPREVRLEVWQRDGGRCTTCGAEFDLQYDHVIPVALGGGSSASNLQLLCGPCNQRKGSSIA
ncbi:MAG: HNH endonuclease signature motif containing protein [Patulibacter sp.]|nr:HNH endonuclease signature motif containing protein [Patulibacter sp.]